MLTLGSLFAGIGAFELAATRAGLDVRWSCEIDAACRSVLARHFPTTVLYEDIRTLRGDAVEPVDVLVGGWPCQDLSVAGKRAGLAGERSGLFHEMVRVIQEMRDATDGACPAIVVGENVPGLLSSHRGRDLAVVLGALADSGALDIGWRVLDAQWFGVAQRRRRVFVVADFGGRRAGEILALADSLSGHPAPRRTAGEGPAGTLGGGSGARGWAPATDRMTFVPLLEVGARTNGDGYRDGDGIGAPDDPMFTLQAGKQHGIAQIAHILPGEGFDASEDGTGRGTPLVAFQQNRDVAHALTTHQAKGGDPTTDNYVVEQTVAFTCKDSGQDAGEVAPTLRAMPHDTSHANGGGQVAIMYAPEITDTIPAGYGDSWNVQGPENHLAATYWNGADIADTLDASNASKQQAMPEKRRFQAVVSHMQVRRLTPTECERLQGFPDGYTASQSDSTRYRQLGNSIAVPVVTWLLGRVRDALEAEDDR